MSKYHGPSREKLSIVGIVEVVAGLSVHQQAYKSAKQNGSVIKSVKAMNTPVIETLEQAAHLGC